MGDGTPEARPGMFAIEDMAPRAAVAGFAEPATVAVGMPRLFKMTRFPSNAAALAAWTASFGWAFLHSTFLFFIV